jgi:hypothetical protein
MLTKLSIVISNILTHEISQVYVKGESGHSIQWNSFGIAEIPDDGRYSSGKSIFHFRFGGDIYSTTESKLKGHVGP